MTDRFVLWWARVFLAATFGFMAIAFAGSLAGSLPWLGAVLSSPFAWLAVRSARLAVLMSEDGVEVRGLFRTQRCDWDEVQDVRVTSGSSTGLRWRIPTFVLRDGEIRAEELRSLREGSVVDAAIAAGRRHLSECRS